MNADELAAATKAAEEAIAEGAWGDRGVVARAFLALEAERDAMIPSATPKTWTEAEAVFAALPNSAMRLAATEILIQATVARQERDEQRARAEKAEAALSEVHARVCRGPGHGDVEATRDCILSTLLNRDMNRGEERAEEVALVDRVKRLEAVAEAALEYLMRSVPDPNTGPAAEDVLRDALAAL